MITPLSIRQAPMCWQCCCRSEKMHNWGHTAYASQGQLLRGVSSPASLATGWRFDSGEPIGKGPRWRGILSY